MTNSHEKKSDQLPVPAAEPPPYLSPAMQNFWRGAVERKSLQEHELLILAKAAESYDRAEEARLVLLREGLTFQDRFGQPRSRPEIAIARDCSAQFAKLLSRIDLHVLDAW